jgi:DNA-binding transcriptional MerR regulator
MQQLTIGAFSRISHLSVKTLRYYHEVGLLEPAVIDPDSGYRYYRPGQAHSAHLVRRYRDLGLPAADVKAVLAAADQTARDAILAGHLDRMREQLRQTEAAVDSLRRMLDGTPTAGAIEERVLEGGPTIAVAADLTREDLSSWWWDAHARLRAIATAAGLEQTGPVGGLAAGPGAPLGEPGWTRAGQAQRAACCAARSCARRLASHGAGQSGAPAPPAGRRQTGLARPGRTSCAGCPRA